MAETVKLENNKTARFTRTYNYTTNFVFTRPSAKWTWVSLASKNAADYVNVRDADGKTINKGIIRFGSDRPYSWYAVYVLVEDYDSGHPDTDYQYFNIRIRVQCRMYQQSAYIYCPPYTCVWTTSLQNSSGKTLSRKNGSAATASVNIQDNGESFLATADQGAEMAITAVKRPGGNNKVKITFGSRGSGSSYDQPENTVYGTPATSLRIQNILGSIEVEIDPPFTKPNLKILEINSKSVDAKTDKGYSYEYPIKLNADQKMNFKVNKCGDKKRDKYELIHEIYRNVDQLEWTMGETIVKPTSSNDNNTTSRTYDVKFVALDEMASIKDWHNKSFGLRAKRKSTINKKESEFDRKYLKFWFKPIVPVQNLKATMKGTKNNKVVSLSWNFPDYKTVPSVLYNGKTIETPYGLCNGYRIQILSKDLDDKVVQTYLYHTKTITGVSFTIPSSSTTNPCYLPNPDKWDGFKFTALAGYKIKITPFYDPSEYPDKPSYGEAILYGPPKTIDLDNPIEPEPPAFASGIDYPINGETWVGNKLYVCFTLPIDYEYIAYRRQIWNEAHTHYEPIYDKNGKQIGTKKVGPTPPYNENEWMTDPSYAYTDCTVSINGQSFSFTGNSGMFSCKALRYQEKVLFSTRHVNISMNYGGSLLNRIAASISSPAGSSAEISTNIYCLKHPYGPKDLYPEDYIMADDFNTPAGVACGMARCYAVHQSKSVQSGDIIKASDFDEIYNILSRTYDVITSYPSTKDSSLFPGFKYNAVAGGTRANVIIKGSYNKAACYFMFLYDWINNFD